MFINLFPVNPVDAMARADMLQIIVFALFLGVAMAMVGDKAAGLRSLFDQANEVILKLVGIVMGYAPFGVAALMAWVAGAIGFSIMVPLAKYLVGVAIGAILHAAIIYSLIVGGIGGVNPSDSSKTRSNLWPWPSTCSSAAALPLNMAAAERKMGCLDRSTASACLLALPSTWTALQSTWEWQPYLCPVLRCSTDHGAAVHRDHDGNVGFHWRCWCSWCRSDHDEPGAYCSRPAC